MFQGVFIPNALLAHKDLSQSAKLMWGRLAQYAGKDGRCFPKIETLGEDIGISGSMARKVIRELKSKQFILVKNPKGKERLLHMNNEYFFLDHPSFHTDTLVFSAGIKNGQSEGITDGRCKDSPEIDGPNKENHIKESYKNSSEISSQSSDGEFFDSSQQKKTSSKTKEPNTGDLNFAHLMFTLICKINSTVKSPNFNKWADTIRLMRECDKRTYSEIEKVFRWANQDSFWQHNCMSPANLRKNYSTIAGRFIQSGGTIGEPPKPKQTGYQCKDCAKLSMGWKGCSPRGKDKPEAPACPVFQKIEEEAIA